MKRFMTLSILFLSVSFVQAGIWGDVLETIKGKPSAPKDKSVICASDLGRSNVASVKEEAVVAEVSEAEPSVADDDCRMGEAFTLKSAQSISEILGNCECGGQTIPVSYFSRFNHLKNATVRIPAGTKVTIPTCEAIDSLKVVITAEREEAKRSADDGIGAWKWRKIGGDPFGNRDWRIGLSKAGVGQEVIAQLEMLVEMGEYEEGVIRNGDALLWMLSGDFHVKGANGRGVEAAWDNGRTFLPAQIYSVEMDNGLVRRFARPDICFNWCELPPVRKVLPPPVVETPPDTTWNWVPDEPESPPDTPVVTTDIPVPPPPPAPDLPSSDSKGPIARLDLWYGHDFPTYGPFRRHGANFYGAKGDLLWQTGSKTHFGMTGMVDGWDGESRSGFTYNGFEVGAGPLLLLSFNSKVHWGIDMMLGGQWDWGRGNRDWDYESFQTGLFFRPGMTLDVIGSFLHLSSWASYKKSFNEEKESDIAGVRQTSLSDPANDKSGWDGGARLYFWQGAKVSPLLVWRESYAYDDHAVSTTAGLGIRFWEKRLVFETSFKNRSNSKYEDGNGNAIELLLNLSLGSGRGKMSMKGVRDDSGQGVDGTSSEKLDWEVENGW